MTNEDVLILNREKNVARLTAINSRLGIGSRPMPRTVDELTALVGRNPLIDNTTVEIPVVDDKPCAIPEQELVVVETAIRSRYDIDAKPISGPMLTCREILSGAGLPGGKVNANVVAAFLARLGFQLYSSNGKKGYRLQGLTS